MRLLLILLAPFLFGFGQYTPFKYIPPVCEDITPESRAERKVTVLASMSRDAVEPRRRAIDFTAPRSATKEVLIDFLVNGPEFQYGPRIVPLVIALHETAFQSLRGDHHLGNGVGVSCGLTQIRTDFPGRPRCEDLLRSPEKALGWTATHLNRLYTAKACTENGRCMSRYAGAGPKAREFAQWVTETAQYVESHVAEEESVQACLPHIT